MKRVFSVELGTFLRELFDRIEYFYKKIPLIAFDEYIFGVNQ